MLFFIRVELKKKKKRNKWLKKSDGKMLQKERNLGDCMNKNKKLWENIFKTT